MMKANDWLLKEGHIKEITRGRRSLANINHLMTAYQAGTRFSDWEPKETVNTTTGETRVVNTVKAAGGSQIDNYNEPFIRYPGEMDSYTVTDSQGNKRSLKEACNNCGLSLVGHTCNNPVIVRKDGTGSTKVNIVFGRSH